MRNLEFFEFFDFEFLEGNAGRLNEPNVAFISETTARKYFDSQNPLGMSIQIDGKTDYLVAGIFKDVPRNSHIKFDILLSYENLLGIYGDEIENAWGHTGWFTYLLLRPGTDLSGFKKNLQSLVETEFGDVLRHYGLTIDLVLQPLTDIHLNSHYMQEFEMNGNANTVKYLSLIAMLIMVLAWVNYINLSTARSINPGKGGRFAKSNRCAPVPAVFSVSARNSPDSYGSCGFIAGTDRNSVKSIQHIDRYAGGLFCIPSALVLGNFRNSLYFGNYSFRLLPGIDSYLL